MVPEINPNNTPSHRAALTARILQMQSRALAQETHILTRSPELLWQQLYNRLQWEGEEMQQVLAPQLQERSRPGASPWFHRYNRLRESNALIRTLTGNTSWVMACAFSPNSQWIVSTSKTQAMKIWDAVNGSEQGTLGGVADRACAVSPDGTRIISVGWGKTIQIWDVATRSIQAKLTGQDMLNSCALSPDGAWFVTGGWDKTLKIWDTATGAERKTFKSLAHDVNACAVSPDGTWIVSAGEDRTLRIWDASTGKVRATLRGHKSKVKTCAISPDGAWIVSGCMDGTLKIWDVTTRRERATLAGHTSWVSGCAVSPDGKWIVSSSGDHTLKIWDAVSGSERATLAGHVDQVYSCAVSPDGTKIVSAGADGTLKIWDALTLMNQATSNSHTATVNRIKVYPDGIWAVSASWDKTLKLWDIATGNERITFKGHTDLVNDCAISPDGSWIVSASSDKSLIIWNTVTGSKRATLAGHNLWLGWIASFFKIKFSGHSESVYACAVSPDGTRIVSSSGDRTMKIWNAATGAEQMTLTQYNFGQVPGSEGSWMVSTGPDDPVKIWDMDTRTERPAIPGYTGVQIRRWAESPDRTWFVTIARENGRHLKIVDPVTGSQKATFTGHTGDVRSFAVSPDGKWIASTDSNGYLILWDTATGHRQAALALTGAVTEVEFHPFLPVVICGDAGGNMYFTRLIGIQYASPAAAPQELRDRGLR